MNMAWRSTLLALLLAGSGCGGGGGGGGGGLTGLSVSPATLSLVAGGVAAGVTATLVNGTGDVTWSLSPGNGTLSATSGATVFYTPPAAVASTLGEVLTASAAGQTAQVTITVSPKPLALTISPPSASAVAGGAAIPFTASLSGAAASAATWTLSPSGVGSLSGSTGATVSWTPPPSVLQATSAMLTASAAGATATATITVVPTGAVSIANWTYHPPSDWTSGTLALPVATGQSAMVILLNTDPSAADNSSATLTVTGSGALSDVALPLALDVRAPVSGKMAAVIGHERARAEQEASIRAILERTPPTTALVPTLDALVAAVVPPPTRTFCVGLGTSTTSFTRRSATLRSSTAHALFYVDTADNADLSDAELSSLGSAWDLAIYPADTTTFGPESDVDGNNKLTILFTSQVGPGSASGVVVGYFWAGNVFLPADTSAACDGTGTPIPLLKGSNGADLFVMNTPSNLIKANFTRTQVISETLPGTLAHEFQHLINFNMHCVLLGQGCSLATQEATWLNEGLSMVATDTAGYGWSIPGSMDVIQAQLYLGLVSSGNKTYSQASMTVWEGDPIGNYEGVHSFLRYLTDRKGTSLLTALSGSPTAGNLLSGKANLAFAAGATFESAMADFTTAAAFSNESFVPDPRFNYTGTSWTPFHTKLRHLEYKSLNQGVSGTATLRQDGWNAFATGAAGAGGATIQVTSSQAVKPAVLLITFTGALPKT